MISALTSDIAATYSLAFDAIEKLAADLGGSAHPADLSDPAQVATLINHVEDEAGPIDVLVNNAGRRRAG